MLWGRALLEIDLSQSQCRVGWSPQISRTPPEFQLSAPFAFSDTCALQKLDPALIARFRPAMIGCFAPVDRWAPSRLPVVTHRLMVYFKGPSFGTGRGRGLTGEPKARATDLAQPSCSAQRVL